MKAREVAGAINRARRVYIFCPYGLADEQGNAHGIELEVPKTIARQIVQDAYAEGVEIDATVTRHEVHIG